MFIRQVVDSAAKNAAGGREGGREGRAAVSPAPRASGEGALPKRFASARPAPHSRGMASRYIEVSVWTC